MLASSHLSSGPAHSAKALGTRHSHNSFHSPSGWNNLHQAARIAWALLVATKVAVPLPRATIGHEWAYPHIGQCLPHCVPASSEACQALDCPWKTRPGQIEHSESYKARCHLSSHQRVSNGQIMPFSWPKQNKSQTKTAEI